MNLDKHKAMWERKDIGRPLLGINVGFMANQRFPLLMECLSGKLVQPEDIRVDLFLKECDRLYELHQNLCDYPYVAAPFAGMAWLEAIMGCPIMSSPTNLWAEPFVSNWDQWSWRKPDRENPWFQKLLELTEALAHYSKDRFPIAPTLMRGPADILSAIRGASQFSLDCMDQPDIIKRAAEICADLWIEVAQAQLELIPYSDHGYMAGDAALRSWAPEKLVWLQEDAMSLLSPSLYRDLFLPLDRRIAKEFACTVFHLHGSALWAVDDLINVPEIQVIELNLEDASCDVEGTFAGWKKIQAHKPLVIWRMYGTDFRTWLEKVLTEIPSNGLSIQVSTNNIEQAKLVQKEFFETIKK